MRREIFISYWLKNSFFNGYFFAFQDLKRHIVDEALIVLINIVIIPHSGWDPNGPGGDTVWSTVFRNSSGILRYAKPKLVRLPAQPVMHVWRVLNFCTKVQAYPINIQFDIRSFQERELGG